MIELGVTEMKDTDIKIRCSGLPLAFKCPESVLKGDPDINIGSDIATMGTIAHAALAHHVRHGDAPDLAALAQGSDVDQDELEMLFWRGVSLWKKLADFAPEPQVEISMRAHVTDCGDKAVWLSGTADVLSAASLSRSVVLDWKTGYIEGDYGHQAMGYGYLSWLEIGHPLDAELTVILAYPRLGLYTVQNYTAVELSAWGDRFETDVIDRLGTFQPGPHCQYCSRYASCPGRGKLAEAVIKDLAIVSETPPLGIRDIPPEKLELAFAKIKFLESLIEKVKTMIRLEVQVGGPLPLPGGKHKILEEYPGYEVDARVAWPIVSGFLDDDEINACLSISRKKMLDAISAKQPKGQKGKTKTAVMKLLTDAHAVSITTKTRLVTRAVPKEIEGE